MKQSNVSTLCQHLDQALSFSPQAVAQLSRRDHLSSCAPAENPGCDLVEVAGSVVNQKLVTGFFFGDE